LSLVCLMLFFCFSFFFHKKEYPTSSGSRLIPSYALQKSGYAKTPSSWNSCCTYDIPSHIVVAIFWTYSSLIFFFSSIFFSSSRFSLATRKRKILLNSNFYLLSSIREVCSSPRITDIPLAQMLSIPFRL
jgi:hypothetical protein